jgi:tRNA(fMet)-specific endonuclease VapC
MHLYMLDTDISSDIIKQRPLSVLERFEQLHMEQLCISAVTYAELRYGAERSSSQKVNLPIVEDFVSRLSVLPWDKEAAAHYGHLRNHLEREGTPLGGMDTMIAAHALSRDSIVVTNNLKHFQQVPRLVVENWLSRP